MDGTIKVNNGSTVTAASQILNGYKAYSSTGTLLTGSYNPTLMYSGYSANEGTAEDYMTFHCNKGDLLVTISLCDQFDRTYCGFEWTSGSATFKSGCNLGNDEEYRVQWWSCDSDGWCRFYNKPLKDGSYKRAFCFKVTG